MNKTVTGILAYTPVITYFSSLVLIMYTIIMEESGTGYSDVSELVALVGLTVVFVCVIVTYVDIVMFIIKAGENRNLSTGKKTLWGVLMYFFNIFIFPVYWHLHILREK